MKLASEVHGRIVAEKPLDNVTNADPTVRVQFPESGIVGECEVGETGLIDVLYQLGC